MHAVSKRVFYVIGKVALLLVKKDRTLYMQDQIWWESFCFYYLLKIDMILSMTMISQQFYDQQAFCIMLIAIYVLFFTQPKSLQETMDNPYGFDVCRLPEDLYT